jgi:ELWxxDGT repeat protein
MKRLLLAFGLLVSIGAAGQTVNLLKDINTITNTSGSSPANFTNVGGVIFFTATDPERGTELWKTNGTGVGTVVVKDINPGSSSSIPSSPYLTAIGSTVYFTATDGLNGYELWKSDGTDVGTVMVKDINTTGNSTPSYIIAVGSNLYFAADNGTNGRELWKSDGTTGNTVMLTEIYSGSTGSNPLYLTNANGTIYFRATHPSYGTELWKTTGGAPSLVEDIYSGSTNSSSPYNITALNAASSSIVLFAATDGTNGTELWVSSGTAATTNVVSIYSVLTGFTTCGLSLCPVYDYSGSSSPDYFASTGSYVYFAATSSTTGREVYRHNGTTLALVEDEVASGDLNPLHLTNVSGTIFFSGSNGGDRELYKATTSTVTLVTNINGSGSSSPTDFEAAGTSVYFSATGTNGTEFYRATTSTGAVELSNINPGTASSSPTNKAYLGGVVYLSAIHDTYGRELFLYNGSSTSLLKDINGGTEDGNPYSIFNTGTTLYFPAQTSALGYELWKSDGTTVGTVNVADINTTAGNSSYAFPFAFNNSLVHLQAYTATKGYEFYVSTGAVGNYTLREINTTDETGSSPASYGYVTLGNDVYFSAYHPLSGTELWRSNLGGTATLVGGGTGLYSGTGSSYPGSLTVYGSYVYFAATDDVDGRELYRTLGGSNTLQSVANLNISGNSNPEYMCVSNGVLYWAADNGADGVELFRTTGTGATMVKTGGINSGSSNANPQFMTDVNGTLFFRAIDGTNGSELWKSDGTSAGTVLVKNIHTTANTGSDPSNLTAVGTTLYFTANEPTYGTELYKSDGTTAGTVLVKDIFSGTSSSSPLRLKNINGTLYFRASNGTGLNLMKTNGTAEGTIEASSAGVSYQGVDDIQYLNQNVYWVGTTNTYGKELLYVKAEPLSQPTSLVINGATQSTLNLSWTAASGSPAGYIVARHSGSTPTGLPVDGTAPALNTPLTSGTGTVAYVGSSTSFTDTGLSPTTTYYYAVYSYNNGGSSVNVYKPHSPLTGNNFTLAANPTTQAHTPFTSNVATTSITFNWTSGNGSERIVLARATSAISDVPVDGTAYTANAALGLGSLIGSSRVVYRGTGSSVNVTQLSVGTQYHFKVFELNGTGTQTNYLTSIAGATGSATTLSVGGNQPTDLIFSSIGTNSISLSWSDATAGSSDNGYIVTRKAGSDPTDVPVNMTPYSAGNMIGTSVVVYNTDIDANTSFADPVALTAGTVYFYRVYAKSDVTTYIQDDPLSGAQTTLQTEPTTAPGAISYTPATTSLTGTFTAGTGATSYIVLQREAGIVSPDAPVDGVNYTVGQTIGSSEVVFVGTLASLPFTSLDLTSNTLYYYAAFSASGSGPSINYLTSSSSASSRATLVDEPTEQPTSIGFSNLEPTSVDVSFVEPVTIPTGYIVLRNEGGPVTDEPADGVAYVVDDDIGSSTVVHDGSIASFSESALTPGTTYHYAVMSYNGFGETRNYLVDGAAAGSIVTPAAEPTAQPTSFNFTDRTTTSLSFTFSAAAGTPTGYLIIRSSGAAPTAVPTDGEEYTAGGSIGADVVVQVGSSTSVVDDNFGDELVEDTRYYYAIYSYNGTTGTYNYLTTSPLQNNAFTWADEPTEHPTNMAFADPTTTSMTVAFDEPASLPAGYLVVRKATTAPTGVPVDGTAYTLGQALGDGTVAYIGASTSFSSTGLSASNTYHYAVYPYKGSGVSSNFLTAPTVLIGNRKSLNDEPLNQPTALEFSSVSTSTVQIDFTPSDADRYIVIRRAGSPPTEVPVDGDGYPSTPVIGSSVVTYTNNQAGFPFIDGDVGTAPMTAGTTYHYAIYAFNGIGGGQNYLTTSPALTGSVAILALAPTAQATGLTFSNVTSSSLTGTFTAAAGSPTGYLVVRRQNSLPTGTPVPATTYNVGDPLGDGTVVHAGSSLSFNDTGLSAEGTYHYRVYSYNGDDGSTNYLTTSPLSNNITTLDSEPSQPTGFSAARATTSFQFGFTASDAERYLILRRAGSSPTETPVDGIGYTAGNDLGASKIVLAGVATLPITDGGLTPETVYHYAIFGFNGAGASTYNYNIVSPLTASLSTLANEPANSPSALIFSGTTVSATTVSFTAATGSPSGYLVIRKQGSAPSDDPIDGAVYSVGQALGDGTIAHLGSSTSFGETGLSAETTYHYKVFSYNGSGSAVNFLTLSSLSGSFTTLDVEPAQPTAFTASNLTTTSFSISMTLSDAEKYLILRKAGSAPEEVPLDGTAYVTGQPFGSSHIVLAGEITLPISQTGLTAGTVYHYVVFGYNGTSAASYNYNTTAPLTESVGTMAPEPTSQATSLVFSNVSNSSATVSFAAATSLPAGYLVIRREGALPSTPPADGETYVLDDAIADAIVVHVGTGLTFNDSGLTDETIYYYQVFAYNGSGLTTNYRTASPLTNNFSTLSVEPSQPTAFVGTSVSMNSVSFSFTLSGDAQHYLILRKAGSAPTAVPADGTAYTTGTPLGDSDIFLSGNIGSLPLEDDGLAATTVYHYTIFPYNGSGVTINYNTTSPLTGSVGTLDAEPTAQPVNLVFSAVTATGMTATFSAAVGTPDGYIAIRKENSAPVGSPVDGANYAVGDPAAGGVVAYIGSALTFTDSGLNPEVTYHYNIFSFNGSGLTASYLKTSPLTNSRSTLAVEPEQPTGFVDSNIGANALSIEFTESDAAHYLILRKAGTAPTENPVDGTGYVTGTNLGTSFIVLAGDVASMPIDDEGLLPNTVYHYKIFGYNGSSTLTNNYNITSPLLGTSGTLAAEPSSQPSALDFDDITTTGATVSFTPAAGSPAGYLVVRKQDTAPAASPVDGVVYSNGDPLGGGLVVNVGSDLSFTQSGLTAEKVYHYQVFSYNGSGQITNYLSTSPATGSFTTLAVEPTAQPTLLEFTNIDTNGFTVSFVAATGTVSGYIALRKEGSDPTAIPVDGTTYAVGGTTGDSEVAYVGSAVTFDENTPPGNYHYAVFSFNGSGASINYRTVAPLIGALPSDETPPVIVDHTDNTLSYKSSKTFSFVVTDDDGEVSGASLIYRRLNEIEVERTKTLVLNTSNSRYEATLSIDEVGEQGLVYHGLAINEAELEATTVPVVLRTSFTNSHLLPPLQQGDEERDYRIISVPLVLTNKGGNSVFAALADKENGTEWRMFRWQNNDYHEFTELGDVQVNPGEGYWLISKSTLNIAPGIGQAVDITTPFSIPVTSGWNQIGNPYLFNVVWDDVNEANGSAFTLRTFEGGTNFVNGIRLNAFSGGFVFVGSGITSILIPTEKSPDAGRGKELKPKINPLDSEDWEVIINLKHGDVANPFGGVGMSREAKVGFDYFDDFSMPRFMDFVELSHPKTAYGASYTKDIIPVEESHVWEFSIQASSDGITEMTWDNAYFGANDKELVLWDEEEQMAIDMRKEKFYSIAHHAQRRFKIFYGNQQFIEEQAAANSVLIHTISPNPTTADVSVSFSIPGRERSNVNVRVVNGMGQQIATVFDGELEAGFHSMQWSGNDYAGLRPATGVYLVEVINGEHRTSKRLVLK